MNRRKVLSFVVSAVCAAVILWPLGGHQKFVFKIKTTTGEIVVNIGQHRHRGQGCRGRQAQVAGAVSRLRDSGNGREVRG